jgi:hypothetical protein
MNDEVKNTYDIPVPKPEKELTQEQLDAQFSGDVNDIMEEIIGVDNYGASRSVVLFTIDEYENYFQTDNPDEFISKTKRCIEINHPIVDIIPISSEYNMVILKFQSDVAADLRGVWEGFNYYTEALNIMNEKIKNGDNTASAPILTLTFMPKKYNGDYFVAAASPIFWSLSGDEVGDKVKEVRILYKSNDVCYMKSELTELEKQQIDSEVQREASQNAEWLEECYRKDAGL